MAVSVGVSAKTIERELAAFFGIVCYIGSKKSGYWQITTDN